MLTSMTGFGRAGVGLPSGGRATVEIQTLNHKFLDLECRLPDGFQGYEESIRSLVRRKIRRGRVKVSVTVRSKGAHLPVVFQGELARRYMAQIRALQRRLKVPGSVDLQMLLNLPQVMAAAPSDWLPERWRPQLTAGISQALTQLTRMRRQEGERLRRELEKLLRVLDELYRKVRSRVPAAQKELGQRLAGRIRTAAAAGGGPALRDISGQKLIRGGRTTSELQVAARLGNSPTEAERTAVIVEAASLVQATDVAEELSRIRSHLEALAQALQGRSDSPGRTIDFLAQELHREVNTLGSKLRDASIVRWVVAMKGQIEKLREQAANVE